MDKWEGEHGVYPVPEHLQDIKVTRAGWPDKRDKRYQEFMNWVKEKDKPKPTRRFIVTTY